MEFVIIYLIVINIVTFFLYGSDKKRAKEERWRISERRLLLAAGIGGSLGAFAGMQIFRHKIRKRKFSLGVPLILLLQVMVALCVNFIK